jgi:hypothetical protein
LKQEKKRKKMKWAGVKEEGVIEIISGRAPVLEGTNNVT